MGLTSSSRMDRERPKKIGGGGNDLRRDFAPLAGGRRRLVFWPTMDLALNSASRRGISCRIYSSTLAISERFHNRSLKWWLHSLSLAVGKGVTYALTFSYKSLHLNQSHIRPTQNIV
jgi:hypothetical protein